MNFQLKLVEFEKRLKLQENYMLNYTTMLFDFLKRNLKYFL